MVICILLFFLAIPAHAELVLFRNGDRLAGDWIRVQGGSLMLRTENMGEVTIPVAKVKSFASSRPAVVLLRGDQVIRGRIALLASGEWEVRADRGVYHLAPSKVEAIYPPETYEPRSPERRLAPWQGWKGSGSLGYSLVRGEREAGTISLALNATRRHPDLPGLAERWRTHYFLTTLLASARTAAGIQSSVTSGLRQDFLFTPTNFLFVLAQLDHIQAQSLDLRQTYGLGLGRDLFRGSRLTLSFLGGTTLVKEKFQTNVTRNNSEGLLGQKLTLRLLEGIGLDHLLNFYPSLSDGGRFRFDTTSTLTTRLSRRVSLNTGFTDRYLSQPLPGLARNEFVLTTGFSVSF